MYYAKLFSVMISILTVLHYAIPQFLLQFNYTLFSGMIYSTLFCNVISVTGGSCLSWIFWEHENLSCLSVIWLIYIKLYRKKGKNWQKIWAKQDSGLTAVWLKWDPHVHRYIEPLLTLCHFVT